MPQRQIVRAQLFLDPRPERPGLDACGAADPVDLEHRAHDGDVQRDRRFVEARLDTADHRAATAVRNDRNPLARTPIEHVNHVLFAARSSDQVGDVVEVALQVACDVTKRLAARVPGPINGVGRAEPGQRRRRGDSGGRQPERGRVRGPVVGQVMARQQRSYP